MGTRWDPYAAVAHVRKQPMSNRFLGIKTFYPPIFIQQNIRNVIHIQFVATVFWIQQCAS